MDSKTLLIVFSVLLSFDTNASSKAYGNAEVLKVTSVFDGDSFRADLKGFPAIVGEHMAIRINGIDTPELRGECDKEKQLARAAKQFSVERLRVAKNITLKNIRRGKYFRLIADVYIDGVSLGEQLIKHGHAVKYFGQTKPNWCMNR